MKIHEYNEMMAYLTRPAVNRTGFKHGGTWKDYMLRGEEYKDLSFEEWLREDKARGGVIGKGGMFQGEDMGYRTGFARPIATEGPSAYIREVLGKLPKGSKFDAEALAREIIKKFPDSSKSFIDKRDGSISTSTIQKVIIRDKSLIPLKLKPYTQSEKTIIRVQNFIDDFIKTNERNPTVGEVKIGAQTDPTQLTKYREAGKITGMQDTVYDAHKIAIDYLNNAERPTIKGLQKLIGNVPVKNAETLLSNMYLRTLEAMRNRAAGIEQPRSVYKDFSIEQLDSLKRKVRAVPGYKDIYSRQIEDLISEAYKNQPKKLETALKKIGRYKKLNEELRKIGAGLELDHPLSYDFMKKAKGGADPEELIRVKPIPERVNIFKKSLDEKLVEISKSLKKNPGDKKVLGLYQDLQSIASDIGVNVGKISKAGNIITAQAAKAGDVPLLPDVKKGAAIQNAFREFVKGIKNDPRMKRLGINVNRLADLAKAKAVDSKEYLKVVDDFVAKAGKFGIPLAGAYGVYKVAGFDAPVMADDTGQMPQGSPGQLSEDQGLSLGEYGAIGAGAAVAAKPAWKYALKPALKVLASPTAGLGFAGWSFIDNFNTSKAETEEGKVYDALTTGFKFGENQTEAPGSAVGTELLFPEVIKQSAKKLGIDLSKKLPHSLATKKGAQNALTALGKFLWQHKHRVLHPSVRLASAMTPVGLTLNAVALGKQLYTMGVEEQKRFEALSPEEQAEERAEQEEFARYSAAEGGRVGFDEGSKPKSPSRRAFIKGITALAALPIVGRFFKLGKVLEAGQYTGPAIEKIKGMPEWFPSLVKKLWNEGEDVTKKMAYKERMVVKRGTLEGGDDVDMIYDMDTGDVSIDVTPKKGKYETTSGAYNKEYSLDYKKGEVIDDVDVPQTGTIDPKTGYTKKVPDEFSVGELEPRQVSPEDVELDGTMTTVDDAFSDLTELEAFAKNKTTKQIHKKKGTKPKDVNPDWEPSDYYDLDYDID